MKLIDAEYTFDNNKLLFYFTADGRIDFRELVKDLASVFRPESNCARLGCAMKQRLWWNRRVRKTAVLCDLYAGICAGFD